jgi:hypothetical protein
MKKKIKNNKMKIYLLKNKKTFFKNDKVKNRKNN